MSERRDRLPGLMTAALLSLCSIQVALWLPGYLARPLFADHDVFATMARGWDSGQLPYRDLISNNFPGTVYLFYGLGKAFGWGRVTPLYAADAALLGAFGAMALVWSRSRFGRALPGALGLLAFSSYYLNLDFSQAAQRDWHAAALVVIGLMAVQAWPGRVGGLLAATGFASGLLVRPQVVLFLPALVFAVTERSRLAGGSRVAIGRVAIAWLAVAAVLTILGFAPLIRESLMGDFLEGLRAVAFGGAYNKKSALFFAIMLGDELATYRIVAVVASLALMARSTGFGPARSLATSWLAALVGALLYAPLSPGGLSYLYHPLWLTWSVALAVLVGLVLDSDVPPKGVLYAILALGLVVTLWPRFSQPGSCFDRVSAWARGRVVVREPPGYQHPYGDKLVLPPWDDYRDLLDHIRARTSPSTRVANLLKGVAITGPTGRLSALPAESATWVFVVKPDDEARFARALEDCPDSVVVLWAPGEIGKFDHPLPKLDEVVRRLYVPDARFGTLAVWRRRPKE